MKIVAGGYPRSGTMSLARLFEAMGYTSIHLHDPLKPAAHRAIKNELAIKEFNLDFPPESLQAFVEHRTPIIASCADNYFESDPYNAMGFYYLRHIPRVNFMLIIRKPEDAANSFLHFRLGAKGRSSNVNFYADKWAKFHIMVLRQMVMLNRPVTVLEFSKYIRGEYNDYFDSIAVKKGIDYSAFLANKINSRGEWTPHKIDKKIMMDCQGMYDLILSTGVAPNVKH